MKQLFKIDKPLRGYFYNSKNKEKNICRKNFLITTNAEERWTNPSKSIEFSIRVIIIKKGRINQYGFE